MRGFLGGVVPMATFALLYLVDYFWGPVVVGIPSYIEYLIEGSAMETERVSREFTQLFLCESVLSYGTLP